MLWMIQASLTSSFALWTPHALRLSDGTCTVTLAGLPKVPSLTVQGLCSRKWWVTCCAQVC